MNAFIRRYPGFRRLFRKNINSQGLNLSQAQPNTRMVGVITGCLSLLLCMAMMPAFAESAPVYDADSMQLADNNPDQGQQDNLPMPPTDEAFVPGQVSVPGANGVSNVPLTLEERLKRTEQQVKNIQDNDAAAHIESLQSQVQSLRNQVDQLTHQLQQVQDQQKASQDEQRALYSELDKRLAQLNTSSKKNQVPSLNETYPTDDKAAQESANWLAASSVPSVSKPVHKSIPLKAKKKVIAKAKTIAPPKVAASSANTDTAADQVSSASSSLTPTPTAAGDQPNVAEEQQIYRTAYTLIKAKKYNDAVNALQGMLHKYPSGQFASNAHYWLGELYGLMGKNEQALLEFSTVVRNYPESPRISDAELKVGLIYAAQFKWAESKSALKNVINHYPGTASSRLASEQLKQIKLAGH